MKTPLDTAKAYLDKLPPAISGGGGHAATFAAACWTVRFGLSDADALASLLEYNRRCQPPWTKNELAHKLRDARRVAGGDARTWQQPKPAERVIWRIERRAPRDVDPVAPQAADRVAPREADRVAPRAVEPVTAPPAADRLVLESPEPTSTPATAPADRCPMIPPPPQSVEIQCVCRRACAWRMAHYEVTRCTCGKGWWALQPKRNGPLVAFPWPGRTPGAR